MATARRNSLVKTDNIFQLTSSEFEDSSVLTHETGSLSSESPLSFPTTESNNNLASTLGFLSWEDDPNIPEDDEPRLDFASLKVCGRKNEIQTLQDAFDRVCVGHAEVVTLCGEAGSGKSTLVSRALREYVPDRDGFFVMGKFDQLRSKEPYSAIIESLSDLCDLIIQSGGIQSLRDELRETLGLDAMILCRLVGVNLKQIIKPDRSVQNSLKGSSMHKAFTRLKLLCQSFLRVVSSARHPVVLFLDDIQWADQSSLKLIRSLLRDYEASHLLVILAYREEEVEHRDLCSLLDTVDHINDSEKRRGLSCTKITVTDMTLNDVNEIVAEVTNLDVATARPLAECVKQKTMGNVFHVLQYIESLRMEGFLLQRNGIWSWDLKEILHHTNVSDNVANLVAGKIKKQKKNVKLVLQLAAYLGSRFCTKVLQDIVYEEAVVSQDSSMSDDFFGKRFSWIISIAKNEGLIEHCWKTEYKFSHDKVQRCLYKMTPPGKARQVLHIAIGEILLKRLKRMANPTRQEKSCQLFLAAEHLNRGRAQLLTYEQKMSLASLNLEVAAIASSQAAFSLASEYLNIILELFDSEAMWKSHRALTIDVYSTLAECEYCDGNFALCGQACQQVIQNTSSLVENIRIYHCMISSFAAQGSFSSAMNLSFSILREMGEAFPRRPNMMHVMLEIAKARLVVTEHSDDDLLDLPISRDPDVATKMKLLSDIAACAYQTSQHGKVFAMVSLRMIQITLREGHTKTSPHAFAFYGVINAFLGKHDEGFRFGRLTLQLLERLDSKDTEARALATVFMLVDHWRRPIHEALPYFQRAFDIGRATGDIEYSFYGRVGQISTSFFMGRPLLEVEALIRKTAEESVDFKTLNAFKLVAPMWQLCLNLMGKTADPTSLSGEAIDMEQRLTGMEQEENQVAIFLFIYHQLKLCIYFECWDVVEEILPLIENKYKAKKTHFSFPTSLADRGLVYFELYRRTQRSQWLTKATKMLAQLSTWADEGNLNCHGFAKLLRAEHMSFKGGVADVLGAYDDAIRSFELEGCIHHSAVGNERAATFLLARSMPTKALEYLVKSMDTYSQWGATAKVKFMASKFADLLLGSDAASGIPHPLTIFTFSSSRTEIMSALTSGIDRRKRKSSFGKK